MQAHLRRCKSMSNRANCLIMLLLAPALGTFDWGLKFLDKDSDIQSGWKFTLRRHYTRSRNGAILKYISNETTLPQNGAIAT